MQALREIRAKITNAFERDHFGAKSYLVGELAAICDRVLDDGSERPSGNPKAAEKAFTRWWNAEPDNIKGSRSWARMARYAFVAGWVARDPNAEPDHE